MSSALRYKPGDKIGGRYRVHKALSGGMGEVYLCLDLEQKLPFALKTFQGRFALNAKMREAFEQEVATWVALEKHPNIVRCFYMDTLDSIPFMVLEWVASEESRGTDLRSWLQNGPLDLQLAFDITIGICRGLIHVANRMPGMVHRDLKPENVLISQGRISKVTDFGLAKLFEMTAMETRGELAHSSKRGTPLYMAPEQWRGEGLDVRTDIYAVGLIFHEMLKGAHSFKGNSIRELMLWHEEGGAIESVHDLSQEVELILRRCLSPEKHRRFLNAKEMSDQLISVYNQLFGEVSQVEVSLDGFTAVDYTNRGITYHALRLYEKAMVDYNQALTLDPNLDLIYVNKGITLHEEKEYEEAIEHFTIAQKINPLNPIAYNHRAISNTALKRYSEAKADYDKSISLDDKLAIIYANRGNMFIELDDIDSALQDFEKAIQLDPNNSVTHFCLGNLYRSLQKLDLAVDQFSLALEIDNAYSAAYLNRGVTYTELGEHEKALVDFNIGLKIDPKSPEFYDGRGNVFREIGEFHSALQDHNMALTMRPASSSYLINRGNTYYTSELYSEAISDFSKAISLTENVAIAYLYRGLTYIATGEAEKAINDLSHYLKNDQSSQWVYLQRGDLYFKLGKFKEALIDFTSLIDAGHNDTSLYLAAYLKRGNTYFAMNLLANALGDYQKIIEIDPNHAKAHLNIGVYHASSGNLSIALQFFNRAKDLGDPDAPAFADRAYKELGQ